MSTSRSTGGSSRAHTNNPSCETAIDSQIRSLVCAACWNTLFRFESFQTARSSKRLYDGYSYNTTWQKIHESAEEGCNWCSLLDRNRDNNLQNTVRVTIGFRTKNGDIISKSRRTEQTITVIINNRPNSAYYIYTDASTSSIPHDFCFPSQGPCICVGNNASGCISAREIISRVSSPSSNHLAAECLEECIHNHELCPKPHPSILPTRIIDCTNPDKPRLVITGLNACAEQSSHHRYVALSYVWGEAQQHNTRINNVDSYTQGIDTNLIPQTIKDAMAATHAFRIQYLWVDALCILQDSEEDKAKEIAQMGNIYRNAYFTIIAASAQRASQGFLQDRPGYVAYVHLPFLCPDGTVGSMSLSPVYDQYDHTQEPVNSRAWCLEERLLSPRALIYASHTLQYHCQTSTVNIGDAISAPRATERLPSFMFHHQHFSVEDDKSTEREVVNAWEDIVQDYTRREHTQPGDRLLACSGLANLFSHFWPGRYLAGLWQSTLLTDLLWIKDYQELFSRPTKYRAPSWSWASIDGRVVLFRPDSGLDPDRVHVNKGEILHCEISLANELQPFGQVNAGVLKVKTVLRNLLWNPVIQTPQLFEETDTGARVPVGTAYVDALEEVSESIGKVWAIPMQWSNEFRDAVGLVIVPAGKGCFRRVGYFQSNVEHSPFKNIDPQVITIV